MISSRHIVMPNQANPSGLLFGGVLLSWIDLTAAMASEKYSSMDVATVHIDAITFNNPIHVGDHVIFEGEVVETGRSSMKVKVRFWSEKTREKQSSAVTEVFVTMVAIKNGKPSTIPSLD